MTRSRREENPNRPPRYRYSKWRWRVLVRALDGLGGTATRCWRLVRPAHRIAEPRRILIVQLDHMGDAVLSSPILPRLKAAFPDAEIDVLGSTANAEVFRSDPQVREVIVAERSWFERDPRRWSLLPAVWRLGRKLRGRRYDWGIDVRGDVATVLVMALAGIPRRAGWTMGGGGFLLTDVAEWIPARHEVLSRMAVLEALGVPTGPAEDVRVLAHPTDDDRVRVATWLQASATAATKARARVALGPAERPAPPPPRFDDRPLLVAHLGAGTAAKRWPIAHWREVLLRFLEDGWRVVVVGGLEDAELTRELPPHPGLENWASRLRLAETAALMERADLFLGGDSGPAHLAACAGIPSVVLFSGTNRIEQWRPWSRRTLVLSHDVPCRPCHHKVCPLADHPCLGSITPGRVHRSALRWWSRQNGREQRA
jgi:ADP-heptose:LPS heptosyltransferase